MLASNIPTDAARIVEPIYRINNGCYITPRESYSQGRKYFGVSPYYFEVDKLTSLEIKDIDHYEMALNLLSLYFKTKEIINKNYPINRSYPP